MSSVRMKNPDEFSAYPVPRRARCAMGRKTAAAGGRAEVNDADTQAAVIWPGDRLALGQT